MRTLLLIPIKLYWVLIPISRRRTCLFKKSCSHYVYEIAVQNGFMAGLKALWYRYKNCRPEYKLFTNRHTGHVEMILPNNEVIFHNEISSVILQHYYKVA